MKKDTLILNIQSFVDVITNSSSELFICDTDKSIETVREILNDISKSYGGSSFDSYGSISVVDGINDTGSFVDDLPQTRADAIIDRRRRILEDMFHDAKDVPGIDKAKWSQLSWTDRDRLTKEWVDSRFLAYQRESKLSDVVGEKPTMPDWWDNLEEYKSDLRFRSYGALKWKEQYLGRIIITSDSDNSIPSDVMDEIESMFNAERYHE